MSIIDKLSQVAGGGIGKAVTAVLDRVAMDPLKKRQLEMELLQVTQKHEIDLMRAATEAEVALTGRIKDLEGTSTDLRSIPIVGPAMLFLRGSFRPLFSYGVLVADWKVFSGKWTCPSNDLLLAINLIVLVFYFGERTIKNLMPLFTKFLEVKRV
jgi:hypothetical protein